MNECPRLLGGGHLRLSVGDTPPPTKILRGFAPRSLLNDGQALIEAQLMTAH